MKAKMHIYSDLYTKSSKQKKCLYSRLENSIKLSNSLCNAVGLKKDKHQYYMNIINFF